jgi:hypothetical protein
LRIIVPAGAVDAVLTDVIFEEVEALAGLGRGGRGRTHFDQIGFEVVEHIFGFEIADEDLEGGAHHFHDGMAANGTGLIHEEGNAVVGEDGLEQFFIIAEVTENKGDVTKAVVFFAAEAQNVAGG